MRSKLTCENVIQILIEAIQGTHQLCTQFINTKTIELDLKIVLFYIYLNNSQSKISFSNT